MLDSGVIFKEKREREGKGMQRASLSLGRATSALLVSSSLWSTVCSFCMPTCGRVRAPPVYSEDKVMYTKKVSQIFLP